MRWKTLAAAVAVVMVVALFGPQAEAAGVNHKFVLGSDGSLGHGKPKAAFSCNDRTGKWKATVRNVIPITPYPNPPATRPLEVWGNLAVVAWMTAAPSFRQELHNPGYEGMYTRGFVFLYLHQDESDGRFDGEASGVMNPAECKAGIRLGFTDYNDGDPVDPWYARLLYLDGQLS